MPTVSSMFISLAAAAMLAFIAWLSLEMAITDAKQQTLALIAGSMLVAMAAGAIALASPRRR